MRLVFGNRQVPGREDEDERLHRPGSQRLMLPMMSRRRTEHERGVQNSSCSTDRTGRNDGGCDGDRERDCMRSTIRFILLFLFLNLTGCRPGAASCSPLPFLALSSLRGHPLVGYHCIVPLQREYTIDHAFKIPCRSSSRLLDL